MSVRQVTSTAVLKRFAAATAFATLINCCALMATQIAPVHAQSTRWGSLQAIGPDTIADLAAKVSPVVVNIVANTSVGRNRQPAAGRPMTEQAKRMRRYYGIDTAPPSDNDYLKVTGSGVIVRSNGFILTSLHVVENANSVTVTLQDGRSFEGTVVARDRFSDLALVKVSARDLPVADFGNADQVRLGDWVIAIGNQFGLGHTVTQGIISGIGREAKGFEKSFGARTGAVRFLQTDAPINPGSSGGPLLNLKGEVIGINTFIRDDAQNIGFAIPANVAKDVAEKLANGGDIAHPYIGIVMKEQDPTKPRSEPGVEVTEVKFRSPAASAGIVPGDVILQIDQAPVDKSDDVSLAVAKCHVGDNIKFKIRHNGAEKEIQVKVDRLPDEAD
jgi:S1-C subfamily serine protease